MSNVTHASRQALVNLEWDPTGRAYAQIFGLEPERTFTALITLDGEPVEERLVTLDPEAGTELTVPLPGAASRGLLALSLLDASGRPLFQGELAAPNV